MLECAFERVAAGEAVLPLWWTDYAGVCQCDKGVGCHSPGKHPLIGSGLNAATLERGQVVEWLNRWPEANLGARTDAVHRIDVDLPEVARLLSADRALALQTETVMTPRPGLHVSFKSNDPLTTRNLFLADGRRFGELRGLSSYVVVPPSRIGTRRYNLL